MLPRLLTSLLTFVVSVCIPGYNGLRSISSGDLESERRWLFYFLCYVVFSEGLAPVVEPVLVSMFSYAPLDVYFDLKLISFLAIIMPRLQIIDK